MLVAKRSISLLLLAASLVSVGCSAMKTAYDGKVARPAAEAAARGFADDGGGMMLGAATKALAPSSSAAPPAATRDRKMIYTARYGLLVPQVEDAVERLLGWVDGAGGYLKERKDGTVICKVPAERFFPLLDRVPELGVVLSEALDAKDVTREMQDLGIRLENARKSRTRLLALLEKATVVEDILKIEKELRRLTEEIERMEGDLRLFEHKVAFSTLTVEFRSNAPAVRTRREASRFAWVRQVGVERVLEDF